MESPLHMRGKGLLRFTISLVYRITPAYAGKRDRHVQQQPHDENHPCICGEKDNYRYTLLRRAESPLHMRGKGQIKEGVAIGNRITPAYAGKRIFNFLE